MGKARSRRSRHYRKKRHTKRRVGKKRHKSRRNHRKRSRHNKRGGSEENRSEEEKELRVQLHKVLQQAINYDKTAESSNDKMNAAGMYQKAATMSTELG